MRIAIISPWNPWPVDSGSRQRADLIIRGLSHKHNVFCIYGLQKPFHIIPALEQVPSNIDQSLTFLWPRGETVADQPRRVDTDLRPRDIKKMSPFVPALDVTLATFKPDVILALEADGAFIANAQRSAQMTPVVVDQWEPSRILRVRLATRLKSTFFWRPLMGNARAITVVTAAERDAARCILGNVAKVHVVANDATRSTSYIRKPQTNKLMFAGNLDYKPNRESILWFISEVLPIIQMEMTGVQLDIIGRGVHLYPCGEPAGVTQIGYVADLSQTYATATVAINPVPSGHGSRVKNQAAIVHGIPLVTFPDSQTIAGHGVHIVAESHDCARSFASACIEYLKHPPVLELQDFRLPADAILVAQLSALLETAVGVNH